MTPVQVVQRSLGQLTVREESVSLEVAAVGIQGPPGAAGSVWSMGTPVEDPDGTRTLFTTPAAYIEGRLAVFLNGLLETNITEASSTSFTFSDPPFSGDEVRLIYQPI